MSSTNVSTKKKSKSKTRPSVSSSSSVRKPATPKQSINDNTLYHVNFQIRGKVQGVHFRKYTQTKAVSLGLRGWVQNTEYNTVLGCMEGPRLKIEQMKQWLKSTGSPKSIISGAEFKDTISNAYTLPKEFNIVK